MTLTPKDQSILHELDKMDAALVLAQVVSKNIRTAVNAAVPAPPPDPVPVPIPDPVPTPKPGAEIWANSPTIFIDSSMPTVTGRTIAVPIGGDFQAALDKAQPGDEITLANGGSWTQNYAIRQKTGPRNWITIRPADMSKMPREGTRMTPKLAKVIGLPILQSPNNQGALATDPAAQMYRLIGIEGTQSANIPSTGLIRLGTSYEMTLADLPRTFVLDRVYLHGAPNGNFRRAVMLNGADMAVVDSYISDCHEHGSDSQAVAGWNGPGPFKLINCYFEAASENVIFGGADPTIKGLIPSDIEIRRCHMTKQLSWLGQNWNVKNLFELKNAQRVLVEGCVMENVWADGQGGSAVNLKSVNQGGTAPWSVTRDVMVRRNIFRASGSGFNLTGMDVGASVPMERVTIMDNLMTEIDVSQFTGDSRGALINSCPIDLEMIHNTILGQKNSLLTFGGPATNPPIRFVFRDSIVDSGQYSVKGPGVGTLDTFKLFMADGRFVGNVVITLDSAGMPAGNFFPRTAAEVGFVSPTNLRLASGSPYKGKATDGRDPGADLDAVYSATAGVVVPL